MHADDVILISVDDHIAEPADMFDAAVAAGAIVYEPKLKSKTALKALPGFETLPGVSEVVGEDSIRIV